MVHGAALKMTAVRQHLLGDLFFKIRQSSLKPAGGLSTLKKKPGKNSRLGVYQQMIAEKVDFQPASEPARLYSEAMGCLARQPDTRQCPLDTIDDAQRRGVRFPTRAFSRRIFRDPAFNQRRMPFRTRLCVIGIEIVEIVEVIKPQFGARGFVPCLRTRNIVIFVEEPATCGSDHAGPPACRRHPLRHWCASSRSSAEIWPRCGVAKYHPPIDLHGLEVF